MCNVLNKISARTTVKYRKTAVCSRRRTVVSLDFVSMALLRYGPYPYRTVFRTAVAVYGTVVSPTYAPNHNVCRCVNQLTLLWMD